MDKNPFREKRSVSNIPDDDGRAYLLMGVPEPVPYQSFSESGVEYCVIQDKNGALAIPLGEATREEILRQAEDWLQEGALLGQRIKIQFLQAADSDRPGAYVYYTVNSYAQILEGLAEFIKGRDVSAYIPSRKETGPPPTHKPEP